MSDITTINFDSQDELDAYVSGESSSARLVERTSSVTADKETASVKKAKAITGEWGKKPSIPRQMIVAPESVRTRFSETRQFVLSDKESLKEWNDLQAKMYPQDSPQIRLTEYESCFSPSINSFVLHVSFAEVEYQQLI